MCQQGHLKAVFTPNEGKCDKHYISLSYFSGSCLFLQVLGIGYFKRPYTSYHCRISVGLVSYVQVLSIMYFQRLCTSCNCRMLVGLVFDSYVQVLGIRYFQRPCTSYV